MAPDLQLLPVLGSAIVLLYHMPCNTTPVLIIDGPTLGLPFYVTNTQVLTLLPGLIFTGTISMWDDDHMQKLNPGVQLPHEKISIFVRGDVTFGTTGILVDYLDQASPPFKAKRCDNRGYPCWSGWQYSSFG